MQEDLLMRTQSYLQWLDSHTNTQWWSDSGALGELSDALDLGATGVTTNPILCAAALNRRPEYWEPERRKVIEQSGNKTEKAENLTGIVVRALAERLQPVYVGSGGRHGYVCAQVDPAFAGDRGKMFDQAKKFAGIAPNISVKLPATAAGLDVLEECCALGLHVTGTVSFTLSQMLAIAERHAAGIRRARAAGIEPGTCLSVIMIGRIDDYLREVIKDSKLDIPEEIVSQAGLAVAKRAYRIFQERSYCARICAAALRGTYHASELAGADLILSVHPSWQKVFLKSDIPFEERIDREIEDSVIERLMEVPEFVRAYEQEGMAPQDFISYGAVQKTLTQFIEAGWRVLEEMT